MAKEDEPLTLLSLVHIQERFLLVSGQKGLIGNLLVYSRSTKLCVLTFYVEVTKEKRRLTKVAFSTGLGIKVGSTD